MRLAAIRNGFWWGASVVVQSVEHLTSVQVMILQFVGSSPTSGSVLTAQSLELLWILCLSLPLPYSRSLSLSLSLKNNVGKKIKDKSLLHSKGNNQQN